METKQISAIEKMKNILDWAHEQKNEFNMKFKSISDIEKAYDFCLLSGWAFLDNISGEEGGLADIESLEIKLGYKLL